MDVVNINLRPDQNIWFTSDLHFGHRNVIRFCERPFTDIKEMSQALQDNWNAVVGEDDYIFNLGDMFWFNDRHSAKRIVSNLKGHKHFLLGNHDKVTQYELCINMDLMVHSDIVVLRVTGQPEDKRFVNKHFYEIVLCHYPCACYSHSQNGSLMFFGHIHSRSNQPMLEFKKPILLPSPQYMDVGTDRHHYTPVSLFQVLQEIQEYPYWDLHGVPKKAESKKIGFWRRIFKDEIYARIKIKAD